MKMLSCGLGGVFGGSGEEGNVGRGEGIRKPGYALRTYRVNCL